MAGNRVPTSSRMGANFEPIKVDEATQDQSPAPEDAKGAKKPKAEKPEATDAK